MTTELTLREKVQALFEEMYDPDQGRNNADCLDGLADLLSATGEPAHQRVAYDLRGQATDSDDPWNPSGPVAWRYCDFYDNFTSGSYGGWVVTDTKPHSGYRVVQPLFVHPDPKVADDLRGVVREEGE